MIHLYLLLQHAFSIAIPADNITQRLVGYTVRLI